MNTMNGMNMANMAAMGGGPVGGGMVMMNNNGPMHPSNSGTQDELRRRLNTYIYDYFLKIGYHDLARNLHRDEKFDMNTKDPIKRSPGRRKDEMNGVDGDAMDMDGKDDIPDDLPRPALPQENPGNGFLFDWFCLFHDIFSAQRTKAVPGDPNPARQYIQQTQSLQRMRESQQNPKYPGPGMITNAAQLNAMRRNGMLPNEMQQKIAQSMTPQQIQAMHSRQMMAAKQQQQMQRDNSDMGMNGQRPGTPGEGDNAGSPSKRPRLDQQFPGGMIPNGRGQGMPNGGQGMLMQSGFHPNNLNAAQFRQNGMQQKAMQNHLAINNAMMGMPTNGSPTMHAMQDPSQFPNGIPMDMYRQGMPMQGMPGGPGGQGGGNHALQDYQMQLMLLEQQNKKRLMMARQEQDNITRGDGGPAISGQVGMQPPGMSPSGSRTGASPNPVDQMKRGTPQMGGMPGSPAAGDLRGGSPAGMHFMNGIPPPNYEQGIFMNQKDGMVPGAPGMRPPNAMDLNMAQRAQQQGRMNQFAGGQPMAQQSSQGQPQPMGTPGQRNEMPPPPGPAGNGQNAQRPAPGSPQPGQAPPTPSQTNKANPKGKKGKEGDTRKRPNKKNSTANAPSVDGEPPATPTPSTPITPVHPSSFNGSGGKAGNGVAVGNPAPTSNPSMAVPQPQLSQTDLSQTAAFPEYGTADQGFNLDFSTLENPDVLENFDFDSFLNNDPDQFNFDPGMPATDFGLGDAVPE